MPFHADRHLQYCSVRLYEDSDYDDVMVAALMPMVAEVQGPIFGVLGSDCRAELPCEQAV